MKVLDILVRHNMTLDRLAAAVDFYCGLLAAPVELDLDLLDGRLRVAQVGKMVLVGYHPQIASAISMAGAVYLVRDIESFRTALSAQGCETLEALTEVVTGKVMVMKHPDGLVVEYVEHLDAVRTTGSGERR